MEIKNVILDWGGIIIGINEKNCVDAFNRIKAYGVAQSIAEGRKDPIYTNFESGRCDAATFIKYLHTLSPECEATDTDFTDAWNAMLSDIPQERLAKIAQIGKRYRLFLLSNTNSIHWQSKMDCWKMKNNEQYSKPEDYFEEVFLSDEMGMMKPDTRIYNKVLEAMKLNAEETLFVDDNLNNCLAATECGIKTRNVANLDSLDICKIEIDC